MSLIAARFGNAKALRALFSKSLEKRRQRLSHAKMRSTTHQRGSTTNSTRHSFLITTNLAFADWPQVFGEARMNPVMLDRLTTTAPSSRPATFISITVQKQKLIPQRTTDRLTLCTKVHKVTLRNGRWAGCVCGHESIDADQGSTVQFTIP